MTYLRTRNRLIVTAVSACFTASAYALPIGGTSSTASIPDPVGNVLTVTTNANRAVINWNTFSIGANETTRFIQPSVSSSVLNRVLSSDPSVLLGTLTSNGRVFLINPNGIYVGQGARIDVAGFVASTLSITDANFLANKLQFDATPGAGSVINQGSITTPSGGTIYLVAPNVTNEGIITTPQGETILAAGQTVTLLDTGTPGVSVEIIGAEGNATNLGQIVADAGRIGIAGVIVRNSGTLNASSVVNEGGRIFLKASQDAYEDGNGRIVTTGTKGGKVEVLGNRVAVMDNANVDASGSNGGGEVLIGGDFQGKSPNVQNSTITFFGSNATVKADATDNGDGGKVIVWADDTTQAYGNISARGGPNGGDGGFVETSGGALEVTGTVNTLAPKGTAGNWLLDPKFLSVAAAGGIAYADGVNNLFANNPGGTTTITPASINASSTNITLQASTDVTFADAVNLSFAGTSLTAVAGRSILVNGDITTNNGDVSLWANDESATGTRDAGAGGVFMLAGKTINAGTGMVLLRVGAGAGGGQQSGNIVASNITAQNVDLQQNGQTIGSSNILSASSSSLITARNLLLEVDHAGVSANGSVGTSASPIRVAPFGGSVINLESHAHEASPGIFVEAPNAGTSLVIGDVPFFSGGVNGIQTVAGGSIEIKATGAGSSITSNAGTGGCGFGAFGLTGGPICAGGASASTIALAATGISIGNVVNAGSGTLTLTSTGTVNQTAPITAGVLELMGDGGVYTLTNSGNQVGEVRMNTGSVVLTNNGTTTVNGVPVPGPGPESILTAATPVASELLGASIAVDGDVMVVGAPGGFTSGSGAAYVYRWNGTDWTFEARLTAPSTINFGQSVSVQGNHIVIGAPETSDGVFRSGAAYAFEWDGSTWGAGTKLSFTGIGFESVFGQAVSIDNNRLVVGGAGNPDGGFWNGKIWFYDFSGGAWVQTGSAKQSDPQDNDYFGTYLDISGDKMIVGAWNTNSATGGTGKAYIFEFNPTSKVWTQTQKLTQTGGSASDNFGQTVSISGDIAVVGAPNSDPSGKTNAGALYIFKYDGSSWVQQQVLTPADLGASDLFGLSAQVRDGEIAVAASRQDLPGKVDAGAIYLFRYDGTAWVQDSKITASNALASDIFGSAVALDGQRTFIGALGADPGVTNAGAAYTYDPIISDATLAGGLVINSAGALTQESSVSAGGAVSYKSGSDIAINGALNAGANPLTFNAPGAVTQSAPVSAASLVLLGTGGSHVLTNAANSVAILAANTGSLNFTTGGPLAIGSVTSFDGAAVTTTSGATTDNGDMTLSATGAINTASYGLTAAQNLALTGAGVTTSTLTALAGKISLTSTDAASDIYVGGDLQATNAALPGTTAAIDLNSGRDILLPSNATQLTANVSGGVSLLAARNVDLMNADNCCSAIARSISAPGDVTITATTGQIFRATGDDYRNVSGANVTLTAGTSINGFGHTAATTGDVSMTVGTTMNTTGFSINGANDVTLNAPGAISAGNLSATTGMLTVHSSGGNIWFSAPASAGSSLVADALLNIQADSVLTSGSGTLHLGAGGDIWLRNAVSTSVTGLGAAVAALDLNAGNDILLDSPANLNALYGGAVKLDAGHNVDLMHVDNCCSAIARNIGTSGDILIMAGMDIFRAAGDDYRNLNANNITLTAGGNISAFGAVNAGGDAVLHAGSGATNTLALGGFGINAAGAIDLLAGGAVSTPGISAGTTIATASTSDHVSVGGMTAADIAINAVLGINTGALTATSGKISLTSTDAASDIYVGGDLQATNAALPGTTAAIDLNSGRDILLPSNATQLTANVSGGVSLLAARNVDLMNADNCCSAIARSISAPGDVTITATTGQIFRATGDDYRNVSGANVTLTAGTDIATGSNIFADNLSLIYSGTFSSAGLSVSNNLAITRTVGDISVGPTSSGGTLSFSAPAGALIFAPGTYTSASFVAHAATGITMASGTQIVTSGAGDALVLDAGTGPFINDAGSAALSVAAGGRWLVWSADPASDTVGGLPYAFKQYNAIYGASSVLGSGNGLLYSYSPGALTVAMTDTGVTKPYDGTANAPAGFTPTFDVMGLASGETANVAYTALAYNNAHVATADTLAASGLSMVIVADGTGALVYGYPTLPGSASVNASITPVTLTASLTNTGVTKPYDGTTTASFTPTYSVSGLVSGDTAASFGTTSMDYNSAHVVTADHVIVDGLSLSDITGSNGSLASDYTLGGVTTASSAPASASITPAVLTVSGNWSSPGSWIGGVLPENGDVAGVLIGSGMSVVYDGSAGPSDVPYLTSAGTLSMTGGMLDVGGAFSTAGFAQSGGTLTADSVAINSTGAVNISGGFLTALNDLDLSAGSVLIDNSSAEVHAGNNLSITASGAITVEHGAHVSAGNEIIAVGNTVSLNNGGHFHAGGSGGVAVAATSVSLDNGAFISAANPAANVEMVISGGDLTLDNGSHIYAGNDALLTFTGANAQLVLNGGVLGPSTIETQVLFTTHINFLGRTTLGGILIDGVETTTTAPGGSGIFAAGSPASPGNGLDLVYSLVGSDTATVEAAKTAAKTIDKTLETVTEIVPSEVASETADDSATDEEEEKKTEDASNEGGEQTEEDKGTVGQCV